MKTAAFPAYFTQLFFSGELDLSLVINVGSFQLRIVLDDVVPKQGVELLQITF